MNERDIMLALNSHFKGIDLVDERVLLAENTISMGCTMTVKIFYFFKNMLQSCGKHIHPEAMNTCAFTCDNAKNGSMVASWFIRTSQTCTPSQLFWKTSRICPLGFWGFSHHWRRGKSNRNSIADNSKGCNRPLKGAGAKMERKEEAKVAKNVDKRWFSRQM